MRLLASWKLAWRVARREARASAPKFLFAVLGVATGVGALTGVRGFADAFQGELRRQARSLMAADVSVRQFTELTPEQQRCIDGYVRRGARVTRISETVSMLGTGQPDGVPTLVSVKAVDPAVYPFYGRITLDPDKPLGQALDARSVAVSDDVPIRLNVQTGSMVKLGEAEFRIVGTVTSEPDRMTGSLNLGPRLLISREGLERTGLMTFGSRASQRILFKLPQAGTPQAIDLDAMRAELKRVFPEAMVADYRESHPIIRRSLERSTTFLSLVSLIALVVGALGVATAIHAHMQQRLDSIAIMKCLGARSSQIIAIYSLQAALIGVAGGVGGMAVGFAVQRAMPLLLAKFFLFDHALEWSPAFAVQGVGVGLLVSLLFTIPPLLSIRHIKPAAIFRREMAEARPPFGMRVRRALPALGAGLVILACVGLIAGWLAESLKMGLYFVGGIAVSLLSLASVAWALLRGLRWLVQKTPVRWSVAWRQGMSNLYRPGNHAPSVLVALGIGVTFTLSVYLLQKSLLSEVASAAPPGAPNVILINITDAERDGVRKLLDGLPGLKNKPVVEPLVAVRLESIDGRPVKDLNLQGPDRRYQSTRQVTWADQPPSDLLTRQGAWWKPGGAAPQVAVAEEMAATLKLKPGMKLKWSAIGREFETPLAAVFRQRTMRAGQQMDVLFNPVALEGLPVQYLGLVRLSGKQIGAFQRQVYQAYPTVTVINTADVMLLVQQVVDQVSLVVRFIAGFAILAGAVILASTVAGTRFRRVRETAVLKTLGAKRLTLAGIFSVEFLILGLVAGAMGSALATAFTRVLMTRLLDAEFHVEWMPVLLTTAMTALLAVAAGWAASLKILSQKPMEVLRDE
jgi:putative ABC transport system permease protein